MDDINPHLIASNTGRIRTKNPLNINKIENQRRLLIHMSRTVIHNSKSEENKMMLCECKNHKPKDNSIFSQHL